MRRLLIASLSVGAFIGAFTVPAFAGTATLWVCHGPDGGPLGSIGLMSSSSGSGTTPTYGGGCANTNSGISGGGVTASLTTPTPTSASAASWRVQVPAGVTLQAVTVDRVTTGLAGTPAAGTNASYAIGISDGTALGTPLESATEGASPDLSGVFNASATGGSVQIGVACPALSNGVTCAAPASGAVLSASTDAIGLTVQDNSAPEGAIGGLTNPVAGALNLSISANDTGLGLAGAQVTLDNNVVSSLAFGDQGGQASCSNIAPGSGSINLPLAENCPALVQDQTFPQINLSSNVVADGNHHLVVTVTDAAGNTTTLVDTTLVVQNNPPSQGGKTAQLTVGNTSSGDSGTGGVTVTPNTNGSNGSGNGSGGVGGNSSLKVCKSPRLSVNLTQKPVKTKNGAVVLLYGHRYRFRGKLTCSVSGKRKPAPIGTQVQILNIRRGRTIIKTGVNTRVLGALTAILAYPNNRTVVFRYKASGGLVAQVKFKVVVVHKPKHA